MCLDIKFKRPDNALVAKRMKAILEGEGKKADTIALEAIVEACGHDIRQVLNQVQFFGSAIAHEQGSQKDTQVQGSPFDACVRLLAKEDGKGKAVPMAKKLDLFYIDADMMPLMVQENYLRPYEKVNRTLEAEDLSTCAYAAEMIATGDAMQGSGDWGLMSSVAAIGTIYPAFLTSADGPPIRPAFPGWLQRRGTSKKAERLAQELYSHIKPTTTCSRQDMQVSGYLEVLHRRMLRPLMMGQMKECAAMLHRCGLTREFFTDQAPALRDPLKLDDGYKKVDGKNRHTLLTELQELQAHAPVKRARPTGGDGGNPWARKKGRNNEGNAVEAADGTAEGDEEGVMQWRKKDAPPKKKKGPVDMSKCSLGGWVKKQDKLDEDGNIIIPKVRKTGILLKFIEGHTNAVRRQVHFGDIIGPWRDF